MTRLLLALFLANSVGIGWVECAHRKPSSLAVPKEESWRFPPATDSVGLDVSWTCSELRWKKNLHRFFETFLNGPPKKICRQKDQTVFAKRIFFFKISSYFC